MARMVWCGIVMVVCMWLCTTVYGGWRVTPQVAGNDEVIKGRLMIGEPNEGMAGAFVSWNQADPYHVWGVGAAATIDISEAALAAIEAIIDAPASWWNLLEILEGRAYIGAEIGAANLAGTPRAAATPLVGFGVGPLFAEIGYEIFEGGRIKGDEKLLAESGVTYCIGIQKAFEF